MEITCRQCGAKWTLSEEASESVCPECGHPANSDSQSAAERQESESAFDTLDLDAIVAAGERPLTHHQIPLAPAEEIREQRDTPRMGKGPPETVAASEARSEVPPEGPLIDSGELPPLVHDVPTPEEDLGPIRVEGMTSDEGDEKVFGVVCRVCDTRIHVTANKIGETVECPICYSPVRVLAPRDQRRLDWGQVTISPPAETPETDREEDELRLSEPVDRDPPPIPEGYGLEPIEDDLLAPREIELSGFPSRPADRDLPGVEAMDEVEAEEDLEVIDDSLPDSGEVPELPAVALPDSSSPHPGRREQQPNPKRPSPRPSAPRPASSSDGDRKSRRTAYERARSEENERSRQFTIEEPPVDEIDLEPYSQSRIHNRLQTALQQPMVIVMVLIASGLLGVGAVFYHFGSLIYNDSEPWGGRVIGMLGLYLGFLLFWLAGSGVLLYCAAALFRDSALGYTQVRRWFPVPWNEFQATFLLFSFPYVLAGLPLVGVFFLTGFSLAGPFRMLAAPLLLLGAWYNRHPLACIAIDAFTRVPQQRRDWLWFYSYMFLLAVVMLLSGLLYRLPFFPVYFVAAVIQSFTVAAFAILSGWHIGRVVVDLEQNAGKGNPDPGW